MAGDWIKMRTDLVTSPKVVRMASALDADRFRIVGGLHSAWSLFDKHSEDGILKGYSTRVMSDLLGWPGFCEAMAGVDWIVETPEGIEMPRFQTHNGRSAKRRAQESDRKRVGRKDVIPSALDADKKRTREEKRREDINKVFQTWQALMNSPQAKLTKDRQAKINARLSEGYSVEDLEMAIRGCASSEFHMGKNTDKKKHNSIELIFRNGEKLETFRGMVEAQQIEEAFV